MPEITPILIIAIASIIQTAILLVIAVFTVKRTLVLERIEDFIKEQIKDTEIKRTVKHVIRTIREKKNKKKKNR